MAYTNSALLLLHSSGAFSRAVKPDFGEQELDSFPSTAKRVVEIASRFEYSTMNGFLKERELSPLALHSLFQVATAQSGLLQDTGDVNYVRQYGYLVNMLRAANKRWKHAGK